MVIKNIHSDISEIPQEALASCGDFSKNRSIKSSRHSHPCCKSLNAQPKKISVFLESFANFESKELRIFEEDTGRDSDMDLSENQGMSNVSHESLNIVDPDKEMSKVVDVRIESDVPFINPLPFDSNVVSNGNKHVDLTSINSDSNTVFTNSNNHKNRVIYQRKYNIQDKPPYVVHVQSKDNIIPSAHHLMISRIILKSNIKNIINTKKIGRGRLLLEFQSFDSANRLLDDQTLASKNLIAFIPSYKTHCIGIIRDIPIELNISEEVDFLESRVKIIDIKRLNRRIKENNEFKYIPFRSIQITFDGSVLPKEIFLYKMKYEVFPYIPRTKVCYSCFRVGHVGSNCRAKARCLYCGQGKHGESEE